ncbi:hypothetical protein [Anaerocolumna sp.]|uniref:hypothetical protein n=1 Tax=Anaerocolumna sp. TaxID=2041569 RepID=UPI0028A80C01|nr:hypothetical protein [Anaerocolumna sp.]
MAVSDDIQNLIIEMDGINKMLELLWLAFQQPLSTMEHAIVSMCVLRKQVDEIEQHLQEILEVAEKEETDCDLEYEP